MGSRWIGGLRRLVAREYFPEWDHRLRWLRHPCTSLAAAASASLLVGVGIAPQGYVSCAALVVVLIVGTLWPRLALRGVAGTLRFDRARIDEGGVAEAELTVVNRWPLPLWGVALEFGNAGDESPQGGSTGATTDGTVVAFSLARIAPWSRQTYRWTVAPARRGEHPGAVPRLTTSFPFGAARGATDVVLAAPLLVRPRTIALETSRSGARSTRVCGSPHERLAGEEGTAIGVREYRRGDGLRNVHWPQSARQGRLIVRERQGRCAASPRILLDANADHYGERSGESSFEWAVRIAASLVRGAARRGERVELAIGSRTLRSHESPERYDALLDALARCRAEAGTAPFERPTGSSDEWRITTRLGRQRQRATDARPTRWIVLDEAPHERAPAPDRGRSCGGGVGGDLETLVVDGAGAPLERFRTLWEGSEHVVDRSA